MARTPRDTVDFFPHFTDASEGDTISILEAQFGNDGYTFWFKLLEKLGKSEGHFLDLRSPIKLSLLCVKCKTTPEKGLIILEKLSDLEAIDQELWRSRVVWCQKFVDHLSEVYKNRRRNLPKKPILTDLNGVPVDEIQDGINNPPVVIPQREIDSKESRGNSVFLCYEETVGKITPTIKEKLIEAEKIYPVDWIKKAFAEAEKRNKRSWGYVESILRRWERDGFDLIGSGDGNGNSVKDVKERFKYL